MPCKNKLDVLYFVCCKFYVAATGLSKNQSYLRIKNHNDSLSNRLRFNLRKDRAYSVQLKLEKLSPTSHLCAKHVGRTGLA